MNNYTWVEIKASTIKHNFKVINKLCGYHTDIYPVIKSNAYGHGMLEVAKVLNPLCRTLAVSSGQEALALRRAHINKSILVLSFYHQSEILQLAKQRVTLPVSTLSEAIRISKVGQKLKHPIKIHLKVDTGTTRIGVLANEAVETALAVKRLPGIKLTGAFSHFADAENHNTTTSEKQLYLFHKTIDKIKRSGVSLSTTHIACTAAAMRFPSSHFQAIRLGIGLYGLWPSESLKQSYQRKHQLRPVLSWHTRIIQIKTIPAGTSVGYGRSFIVKRKSTIAILPIGYWDGFDRKLSNNGAVLIRGQRCPIVGRICMNLTMIDSTRIKKAEVGDRVTLLGTQGNQNISAEELAKRIGSINYEVVTRINPLLSRTVV